MTLGEKLKLLRDEKGWTQDYLGELINSHGRQISKYENDRVTPTIELIIRFAKIFKVSIDYLVFEDSPRFNIKHANNLDLIDILGSINELEDDKKRALKLIIRALSEKN